MDITDFKIYLYESCINGNISENERDEILEIVNEKEEDNKKYKKFEFKRYISPKDKEKILKTENINSIGKRLIEQVKTGKLKNGNSAIGIFFIHEENNEISGYCFVYDDIVADLETVKKYRRNGIGTMLVKESKSLGANYLGVEDGNDAAFDLYRKNGYKEYFFDKRDKIHYMSTTGKCHPGDENIVKEFVITENTLISDKDIYYNKDKFDSGEINLCLITGFSGSGKSTMAGNMEKDGIEKYELDDVIQQYLFTDDNLKEYGDLIYSFFKGIGNKYRIAEDEIGEYKNYYRNLVHDFMNYVESYVSSHKKKKFIIEGVELAGFFKPSKYTKYAVYVKGTSLMKSSYRATKRDGLNDKENGSKITLKDYTKMFIVHVLINDNKYIQEWYNFYKKLV